MNNNTPKHPYIVTGPDAKPVVMLLDARASLSYLARCSVECNAAALTQRTFGEAYSHAWPAFEHDVLVALTSSIANTPHNAEVMGLAAAILLQREIPAVPVPDTFASLLMQSSMTPTGRTIDAKSSCPNTQSIAPRTKEAAKIRRSALNALMGTPSATQPPPNELLAAIAQHLKEEPTNIGRPHTQEELRQIQEILRRMGAPS